MKKLLLLSTILVFIVSCSVSKKPEFKHIANIEVKNVSMRNVTLIADAVFNNPNSLKGTLSVDDIHVFVDNIDVGMISSQEFDVPAQGTFTIPLEGTFSLSKIYKENKNNLLGSVLKMVQTDSLLIQYKGNIRYHLGSFSYPYKIDKEQKVSLK
ncbi:hypothetical protein [Aquimarina sp. 2201CG14-23]|uniref:hypothetical protein n=1 Tax=Aquimarina mycalae TaxID=3040073 RepID=UPI002477CE62|nr:hypothetical protein [Aquimarina sp. 2201CG14-23]MDH7448255.1 hypothetical protein [Aquimarina sp. 2201CG14-23]